MIIKGIMSENNKTEEFLQKLAPCIERGDMDACVEEAARLAGEMESPDLCSCLMRGFLSLDFV